MEETKILEQIKYSNRLESEVSLRTHEAVEAKIKAEKANAAKSEFLANISHELKTPMHSILSFSHFGLKRVNNLRNKIEKDDLEEYFREIQEAGKSLMKLLEQLFDLSHLESGRLSYSFHKVYFSRIVREALHDMRKLFKAKNIKVRFKALDFDDAIILDQEKIKQVIKNLLSNAIHFSLKGKTVYIEIKEERESIMFFIKDEGLGVPQEEKEKIFESFTQSSKSKTGAGGVGLGLSIARSIIHGHQGSIWVESNPKGGSIFYFKLPKDQKDIWDRVYKI